MFGDKSFHFLIILPKLFHLQLVLVVLSLVDQVGYVVFNGFFRFFFLLWEKCEKWEGEVKIEILKIWKICIRRFSIQV